MQQGPGGILLLVPTDLTASSCSGRQHPQLQGCSVSAGPKHRYHLKKIYLENCSLLCIKPAARKEAPKKPNGFQKQQQKIPPKSVSIITAKEFSQYRAPGDIKTPIMPGMVHPTWAHQYTTPPKHFRNSSFSDQGSWSSPLAYLGFFIHPFPKQLPCILSH